MPRAGHRASRPGTDQEGGECPRQTADVLSPPCRDGHDPDGPGSVQPRSKLAVQLYTGQTGRGRAGLSSRPRSWVPPPRTRTTPESSFYFRVIQSSYVDFLASAIAPSGAACRSASSDSALVECIREELHRRMKPTLPEAAAPDRRGGRRPREWVCRTGPGVLAADAPPRFSLPRTCRPPKSVTDRGQHRRREALLTSTFPGPAPWPLPRRPSGPGSSPH